MTIRKGTYEQTAPDGIWQSHLCEILHNESNKNNSLECLLIFGSPTPRPSYRGSLRENVVARMSSDLSRCVIR